MSARPRGTPVEIEHNDRVVITEWRLKPGEETGWRTHARDYVVVYRTAAKHIEETREGMRALDVGNGLSAFRARGIEHNLINAGARDVIFVEMELK